jgi:hypothetical protein
MSPSFHPQEIGQAAMLSDLPFTELYIRVDDPTFGSRYKPDVTRTGRATLISANPVGSRQIHRSHRRNPGAAATIRWRQGNWRHHVSRSEASLHDF